MLVHVSQLISFSEREGVVGYLCKGLAELLDQIRSLVEESNRIE